jgi:hypothetical protein
MPPAKIWPVATRAHWSLGARGVGAVVGIMVGKVVGLDDGAWVGACVEGAKCE